MRTIANRLAGKDGLPGRKYTLGRLRTLWQRDDSEAGRLLADQLAALCEANPTVMVDAAAQVDVRAACPVFRNWDATATAGQQGRLAVHGLVGELSGTPFSDPFDPRTAADDAEPARRRPDNVAAIGAAVKNLRAHGLPLDATMRQAQYVTPARPQVPIQGCRAAATQDIEAVVDPKPRAPPRGVPSRYGQVVDGSST